MYNYWVNQYNDYGLDMDLIDIHRLDIDIDHQQNLNKIFILIKNDNRIYLMSSIYPLDKHIVLHFLANQHNRNLDFDNDYEHNERGLFLIHIPNLNK